MRGEKREESREDRRKKKRGMILEEAGRLFVSNGIENTKIIDIAVAAGVAKGTVYEYFESKEEIALEWIQELFDGFQRGLTARVAAETTAQAKLRMYFEYSSEEFVSSMLEAKVLMHDTYGEFFDVGDGIPAVIRRLKEERLPAAVLENIRFEVRTLRNIIAAGIENGEIRNDLDANLMSYMILCMLPLVAFSRRSPITDELIASMLGLDSLSWTFDDLMSYIMNGIGSKTD